jgi:hypothetical protein
MIVACTALRLAALSRGWRLPGSWLVTSGCIIGTVGLNVAAAQGWADAVAQALAPVSYAVLVEMLAHLLRLHLRLSQPTRPRITLLTWASSPVVTTRVWLHLARTGGQDPAAARALIQQLMRMASRLRAVCPGRWPLGRVRGARTAALQTIRDGLLSAETLAGLHQTTPDGCRPARCWPSSTRRHCSAPHRPRGSALPPVHRCPPLQVHRRAPRLPHCYRTSWATVRCTGSAPTPNWLPSCTGTADRLPAAR